MAELGLQISADTLLRQVYPLSAPASTPVRVLGVDDWAQRRGHWDGTILVDLERHEVIDLLPDREAATLSAWLKEHPEVEISSRDRAGAYAEGARDGAPQAVQVAERFPLLKNVGDALERVLQGQPEAVRAAAVAVPPATDAGAAPAPVVPSPAPAVAAAPAASLGDQRLRARYEQVMTLQAAGRPLRAISNETGLSRATVRKYVRTAACPTRAPRAGLFAAGSRWATLLRERWDAGCQNAATLWAELHAAGFPGSAGAVRRQVGAWRPVLGRRGRPPASAVGGAAPAAVPSPRQVKWWLLSAPDELTDEQRA